MSAERMMKVITMETEAEELLRQTGYAVDRIKSNKQNLTEVEIHKATSLISQALDVVEKIYDIGVST